MNAHRITKLRSIDLAVTDLDRSVEFYTRVWGLTLVRRDAQGRCYLRATGSEHHVVSLVKSEFAALGCISFAVDSRAAVDAFHAKAGIDGITILQGPIELPEEEGGGYGVYLEGPEGLRLKISADVASPSVMPSDSSQPISLTHVVINAADMPALSRFCQDFLGFILSDVTHVMEFLRCPAGGQAVDHHTLALAHGERLSLNHAAFQMHDIDGLMYAAGRLIENGYDIEWGLGRHGPGNNVFTYYVDPDGFVVEYTTEMEKINGLYETRDADYWASFPKRPCRWGVARKPSDRLMAAMAGKGLATSASK